MLISVAMATYNGAKYLREQLDSILNQSIQDFELVVCDDCSTDETMLILEEYAHIDKRIRLFQNSKNLGFKENFGKIIKLCVGEYVALSDQDDIWLPYHLEVLLKSMENGVQITCGKAVFVDEKNSELPKSFDYLMMDNVPESDEDKLRHIMLCINSFQGAAMLIKKSLITKIIPIPQCVSIHDAWFASVACLDGGLEYIDQTIIRYRRHEKEVTFSSRRHSAIRKLIGSTLVNHAVADRLGYIDNLRERLPELTLSQKMLLKEIETILKRRKTIWGRLANLPYLISHFKAIYTYDGMHLFS